MRRKIGDLLVRNGLISSEQLGQALQAQLVFGGRLGTNLVELGFITTNTLAEFLARQLKLPALAPSELNQVPPDAIDAIDSDTAARYLVFPLSIEKRVLKIAMADPTDLSAVDEVAFRTGCRVAPVVAPELLVIYALEKLYNVKRVNRFLRFTASLGGVETGADAFGLEPVAAPTRRGEQKRKTSSYGLEEAVEDLIRCRKNASVLKVLERYLAHDLERVVVCVVDDEALRAWSQSGCTIPPEVPRDGIHSPLQAIEIDVSRSVLCRTASRSRGPRVEPVPDCAGDRLLVSLLDPGPGQGILVYPIPVKDRIEAVAFATGERREGALGNLERYALFATKVSQAIQLVRLRASILAI